VNFSTVLLDIDTFTQNSYANLPLLTLDTYYWHVRGLRSNGQWSDWSPYRWFKVRIGVLGSLTDFQAYDCAVKEPFAFIAGHSTCRIVDIGDKTSPKVIRRRAIASSLLEYNDNILYTLGDVGTTDGYHLTITDISDPWHPKILGKCRNVAGTLSGANDLIVSKGFCYMTSYDNGLTIVDVSNPKQPSIVSTLGAPEGTIFTGMAIKGNYLALATSSAGVTILDINNPQKAIVLLAYNTQGAVQGVAFKDTIIFMIGEYLEIANATEFPDIKPISSTKLDRQHWRAVTCRDQYMVINNGASLDVFDISDLYQPVLIGSIQCGVGSLHRTVHIGAGGDFFFTSYQNGFFILRIQD